MNFKLLVIFVIFETNVEVGFCQSRSSLARGVGVQRRVHYDGYNTSSESSGSWYQRVAAPGPRLRCNMDGKMCANNGMCCSGRCIRGKCGSRRRLQDLLETPEASTLVPDELDITDVDSDDAHEQTTETPDADEDEVDQQPTEETTQAPVTDTDTDMDNEDSDLPQTQHKTYSKSENQPTLAPEETEAENQESADAPTLTTEVVIEDEESTEASTVAPDDESSVSSTSGANEASNEVPSPVPREELIEAPTFAPDEESTELPLLAHVEESIDVSTLTPDDMDNDLENALTEMPSSAPGGESVLIPDNEDEYLEDRTEDVHTAVPDEIDDEIDESTDEDIVEEVVDRPTEIPTSVPDEFEEIDESTDILIEEEIEELADEPTSPPDMIDDVEEEFDEDSQQFSNEGDTQLKNIFDQSLNAIFVSMNNATQNTSTTDESDLTSGEIVGSLERVIESGVIRVGVPTIPIGISLSNTTEDEFKLEGYFPYLLNLVANMMSEKFNVPIQPIYLVLLDTDRYPWQSTLTDYLYSDVIDVGLFVDVNPDTEKALALSQPIFKDEHIAIVSRNVTIDAQNSSAKKEPIGIIKHVPFYSRVTEAKSEHELKEYDSISELRDALKSGEVNSIACMGSMSQWYQTSGCDDECNIEKIALTEPQSFAFAFRKYPLSIKLESI